MNKPEADFIAAMQGLGANSWNTVHGNGVKTIEAYRAAASWWDSVQSIAWLGTFTIVEATGEASWRAGSRGSGQDDELGTQIFLKFDSRPCQGHN